MSSDWLEAQKYKLFVQRVDSPLFIVEVVAEGRCWRPKLAKKKDEESTAQWLRFIFFSFYVIKHFGFGNLGNLSEIWFGHWYLSKDNETVGNEVQICICLNL